MTQQHTPSRNINNPNNTNTGASYPHKTRGTHTRVSRVRVSTVGKPPFPEKPFRSCSRCKESSNSMKMLTARVGRIEQLVNALAKTTRGLASISKREDRFTQNMRFGGLDLTRCTLQELQKLVVATTTTMAPLNPNKSTSQNLDQKFHPSTTPTKSTLSSILNNTDTEKKILHSEPMEDVKIFQNTGSQNLSRHNHQQPITQTPIKTAASFLKNKSFRQDSGYVSD